MALPQMKEQIRDALPKPYKPDFSASRAGVPVRAKLNRNYELLNDIIEYEIAIRKIFPSIFGSVNKTVSTLSKETETTLRQISNQSKEFQEAVLNKLSGVVSPTKAGGARGVGAAAAGQRGSRRQRYLGSMLGRRRARGGRSLLSRLGRFGKFGLLAGGAAAAGLGGAYLYNLFNRPKTDTSGSETIDTGGERKYHKDEASDVAGVGGVVSVKGDFTTLRTASGKTYQVATKYAKNFAGFIGDLEATGYKIKSIGGYRNTNIAGSNRKSIHAYGAAIDINPSANPVTFGAPGRKPVTDMPANVQALAAKWGLGWGGAWRGRKQDAMHFSLAEGPGAVLSRKILEQGGGEASTTATKSYSITKSMLGGTKDTGGRGRKSVAEMTRLAKEAGFNDSEAAIMGAIGAAESSGDPKAHNQKGRDNSYGLWQINMLGRMGPSRRKQLGIDSNEQLKDPKINARAAYMIYKQQGFGAWSVYKSGKYKQFLGTAQSAVSGGALAYAGKSSSVTDQTSTKKSKSKGIELVGGNIVALGKQLQSMGLRVSEHPAFGGVRSRHSRTGGHYDGRAIDVNVGRGMIEANNPKWGPIFDKIAAAAQKKGYRVIWRKRGHYNHMHISIPKGGLKSNANANIDMSPKATGKVTSSSIPKDAATNEIFRGGGGSLAILPMIRKQMKVINRNIQQPNYNYAPIAVGGAIGILNKLLKAF